MSGKGSKGARGKKIATGKKSRSAKAGLTFPVARLGRFLKKGRYAKDVLLLRLPVFGILFKKIKESFGEENGVKVKAFVDSGAQMTLISSACADR